MKVTFISNYMTHHQLPFSCEMYRLLGDDFCFLATNFMEEERKQMGWVLDEKEYPFCRKYIDDKDDKTIMDSDIVLCGGTHELYIKNRLDSGKITFRYFERLYKTGQWKAFSPRGYMRKWAEHTKRKKSPVYLLCAGAYVASDFRLFAAYPDKMFKWGYFPEFIEYDEAELFEKKPKSTRILWSGRMIDWKHAEDAVYAAARLKEKGVPFHLTMIGEGDRKAGIEAKILEAKLSDRITLYPYMKPKEVREHMKNSDIYLMTSDYEEGWGAVVNEAMNSGCAVVASAGAGSVPFLIKDSENGRVYPSENRRELVKILEELAEKPEEVCRLGRNAYQTIATEWTPKIAAERFTDLCKSMMEGNVSFASSGPLSKAHVIAPGKGYHYCKKGE